MHCQKLEMHEDSDSDSLFNINMYILCEIKKTLSRIIIWYIAYTYMSWRSIKGFLDRKSLTYLYNSFVFPYLIYRVEVWCNTNAVHLGPIIKIQ